MNTNTLLQTDFNNLKLFKKGKVRDVYDLGDNYLIVSTDRLSAFDVIMNQGIPDKGSVLTKISEFWFDFSKDIIENHLVTTDVNSYPEECQQYKTQLKGRSMLVKKAEVIPIECIVRGYISGSGWNDYNKTGMISGIKIPSGLSESEKFAEPLFTPSTKAEIGEHDENITSKQAEKIAGKETFDTIKNAALEIYKKASDFALTKGIIIADTKMEFGVSNGKIILVDELLTPDSSRFWPLDKYEKGRGQESYDKQFVRDYLVSIKFNKQPPPPDLPADVISKTREKYLEVLQRLTGKSID
ncbi:MAG: phosphoribosylaminoimidazolesuccinocarboxamide synthase [Ignavibacteriales bacterium]|nr:MAG: phosphoribosylaminoimidazolesuccinocarboxamide synthase [Ignavibacteriales bacterium]